MPSNSTISKKITITHLTRMTYPYICIAGYDVSNKDVSVNNHQIRPEFPYHENNKKWELSDLRNIELYRTYEFQGHFQSSCHSKEDFVFENYKLIPDQGNIEESVDKFNNLFPNLLTDNYERFTDNYKESIIRKAENIPSLEKINIKRSPYYLESKFTTNNDFNSLGTVEIDGFIYYQKKSFNKDSYEQRVILYFNGDAFDLKITDYRFYNQLDNFNNIPREQIINRFKESSILLVSVGLTKPFKGKRWLQLNNFHFEN